MRITELLDPRSILLNGHAADKQDLLRQMVALLAAGEHLPDAAACLEAVLRREGQSTTGIGHGIAIPHCRSAGVARVALAAMVLPQGVEYAALDGQPVHLVFLIATPPDSSAEHVRVLAALARLLMEPGFCEKLRAAATPAQFLALIDGEQQRQAAPGGQSAAPPEQALPPLLAVTACPTGVAHTYMAAEALEQAAHARGIAIKVETNGASGTQNPLTTAEIAACRCVIVAADRAVDLARFQGKPVLQVSAGEGIQHAPQLLDQALAEDVPVYSPTASAASGARVFPSSRRPPAQGMRVLRRAYAHLMEGVSFMLPFVVAGGILNAAGLALDPAHAGTELFGTGTPLAALLTLVGGYAFSMMFPILAGCIAQSIAGRPGLVPGLVGGLLADVGATLAPQAQWISSGIFGAVIAGFFAGGTVLLLQRPFKGLSIPAQGLGPMLVYPVVSTLAVGAVMVLLVNAPMGLFNRWLDATLAGLGSTSQFVLGALLGGMMAVDFGGPINKAAYMFGTAALAQGRVEFMAAVVAGGMVPPLALALACVTARRCFTPKQQRTALSNFLMGCCFITEGALPFAASDPLRVIPSCTAGSALAGALVMVFDCGYPAPHGGIFVLELVQHPVRFLVALGAGTLLAAALLVLLKSRWPRPHR